MTRKLGPALLVAALVLAAAAAPALADDATDAKTHYQKAMAHYAVGEYKEAAAEYEAAYKAKQDPALLYNAAQSHRLANDNQKALLLYKNIVKLYPTSKYAAESKDRIEKLEQAIATTQSPPNQPAPMGAAAPPPTTAPAAPGGAAPAQPLGQPASGAMPPPAAPPPATSPAPAATVTMTSPPPDSGDQPIYTKWWFWGIIGAAAVGGTIAIIAVSSGSSGTWSNVPDVQGTVRP